MNRTRKYCSFMFRLWQVKTEDMQTWVVSIQDTHTGQQQIFSNLDGLIQFLQTEFDSSPQEKETGSSAVNGMQKLSIS